MTEQVREEEQKPVGQPFWRQLGIVTPEHLRTPITVIGAGAIGSISILALAKMGAANITVFDFDTVEDHNWPNQWYRTSDLGRPKVEALREIVAQQTGVRIIPRNERFEAQKLEGIVISAVDSMKVRFDIWKRVKLRPQVPFFVDGRMGGETGRIYPVRPIDPGSIKFYESTLYTDEQASEEPCTERAIIYNVLVIGGIIADCVKKHARREPLPREILLDLKNFMLAAGGE